MLGVDGCDIFALALPGVQGLSPYQPGKPIAELQRELGLSHIVKLASNENPLGPSECVQQALQAAIPDVSQYPEGNGFVLKQALSQHLAVASEQLTLGNGSNDVLELIVRAFVASQHEVIFSQYAFAVYPIVTQAVGARAQIAAADGYAHDLNAMRALINDRTRVIFIANPNNPTGTWLSTAALEAFIADVPPHIMIVLDEAYAEYVTLADYPDGLTWIAAHPNVIVTRTFSKAYGLAGLRVGYSVSHVDVANVLNRVRQPFNVNSLALSAATAALSDIGYLRDSVTLNEQGLAQMCAAIEALGLTYIPSIGNFVTIDMGQAAMPIFQQLLQKGVIVRPVGNYDLPNHLRVSVGTQADNAYFLDCLQQVLIRD